MFVLTKALAPPIRKSYFGSDSPIKNQPFDKNIKTIVNVKIKSFYFSVEWKKILQIGFRFIKYQLKNFGLNS